MSQFVFEFATERHEPALRRLFAESEMEGDIRLSFRREPNYFWATGLFGPFCQVVVARDTATGAVIGVGTRAIRDGFINGKIDPIGYLADLRLDRRYRSGTLIVRAYRHLSALHQDDQVKLYFTLIAEGNRRALDTIATGRAGLPPYHDWGRVLSPAINLAGRKISAVTDARIVRGGAKMLPEIVECINRNHARRQFAPCYTLDQFAVTPANRSGNMEEKTRAVRLRDFNIEDFYVAMRGGKIIGVLGKWDQSRFKQTVVTGYRGNLRVFRPMYNLASKWIGAPSYPSLGEPLRSFYASFIAVDDDDLNVFRALLRQLYNDHLGGGYHYFVVGLHEQDPLTPALSDYVQTPFAARLFVVRFANGAESFAALDDRPPYIELALL
jgi:hypothetical protein